ncbi:uncharacterized protein LOC101242598 isoform X1 [Ciona intestinalis]
MEDPILVHGAAASVMQKLQKSQAARQQAKTKEKLNEIQMRINNTLEDYDDSTKVAKSLSDNMKLVSDMEELEAILKDDILKNKYQQKLTIFIVGYQTLCNERADILSQLYEFFNTYSVPEGSEEEQELSSSDSYLESIHSSVQDALDSMEGAVGRLNDVSRDVILCMDQMHSVTSSKSNKTKKKLEKALHHAKDEVQKMKEKLLNFQQDFGLKEDRLQQTTMQVDAKKVEITHLKKQIDMNKKTYERMQEDLKQERNLLQVEVEDLRRELEMKERSKDQPVVTNVSEVGTRLNEIREAAVVELKRMKVKLNAQEVELPELKQELAEQYKVQIQQIHNVHEEELQNWKEECRVHISDILEMEMSEDETQQWEKEDQQQISRQPSSMSTKGKLVSTYDTSSVSSEKKPLTPGSTAPLDADDEFDEDLLNEEYWSNLPSEKVAASFIKYREKTRQEVARLTENLQAANMLQQSVASEAGKWQEERARLLSHIEQLKLLQEAAEEDAEEAMRNLEEFAAEQEQLEAEQLMENREVAESHHSDEEGKSLAETKASETAPTTSGSPTAISKPTSAATSRRSLASAYRQKIAEKREAINNRKRERLQSAGGADTPQLKTVFDTGLLEEFLRCYGAVVQFKDAMAQEMARHSAHFTKSYSINAILTSKYNTSDDQIQLYVSSMSESVEQSLSVINRCVVDALNETKSVPTTGTHEEVASLAAKLQRDLSDARAEHEKRAQHDAAMIMHLQNTLSETQRGNTTAAGTSGSGFPSSPAGRLSALAGKSSTAPPTGDSSLTVMFTRLDAEHNSKELKKSAAVGKITQETLESVIMTMDAYNAIPARRIQHLARKLVHHSKMKVIETNVRNSNLVTSEVFSILEQMEVVQRRRAQTWGRQMDEMTSERRRLAAVLSDALQRLEYITGVFLIKPVVSYKGKGPSRKYTGKISTRFNKYQMEAMLQRMHNNKQQTKQLPYQADPLQLNILKSAPHGSTARTTRISFATNPVVMTAPAATNQSQDPLTVAGLTKEGTVRMWNADSSLSKNVNTSRLTREDKRSTPGTFNIQPISEMPRIMEMDVTRFHFNTNNIHAYIPTEDANKLGKDRLQNMELLNLRSYTSVPRNGSFVSTKIDRTKSENTPDYKSSAPPTTPAFFSSIGNERTASEVRILSEEEKLLEEEDLPSSPPLPKPPLPPIPTGRSSRSSLTSAASSKDMGRGLPLSPSRSVPEMSVLIERTDSTETPPISARKDMATSPVIQA